MTPDNAAATVSGGKAPLAPLFLVSLAAIGFEIALTRYFAIASWSEYGYWVISITMVGFAVSGVTLSLFKDFFAARSGLLIFLTPPLLILSAAGGFWLTTVNPFNPLELQNPDTWYPQFLNILKYYLALFPYYFLTGLYIGLYFLRHEEEIPRVYGADLVGAGFGSLAALLLMLYVHPFNLLYFLMPALGVAALFHLPAGLKPKRALYGAFILCLLAGSILAAQNLGRADFNEYKAVNAPLHVNGNRVVKEICSPRGYYLVLDNFTERLDTDFTNDAASLGAGAPPSTLGLYCDGNRITSLPKNSEYDRSYVNGILDAFPYRLRPNPETLLIGTRGGFRVREALDFGAKSVTALEPDETLRNLITAEQTPVLAAVRDARVTLASTAPVVYAESSQKKFDVVDISSDHLGTSETAKFAFTVEALAAYLDALAPGGVVSVPVSIREVTVYGAKALETARAALLAAGVGNPGNHVMVYRSAWNARILLSKTPFGPQEVASLKAFTQDRSFDTSYYPGIDPETVEIWNDLPPTPFEEGEGREVSEGPSDDLRDQAMKIFSPEREKFLESNFFSLTPTTIDRPFFHSVLRLENLPLILKKISLVPREELSLLINVAVLLQAVALAAVILVLPLLRWRHKKPRGAKVAKSIVYFASLGLGFLFIEMLLIEKASFYLNDRTYAFSVILAAMLMFSGFGSYLAGRHYDNPRAGIVLSCSVVLTWLVLAALLLDRALLATLAMPGTLKVFFLIIAIAPVSIALGFPFPLGLHLFRGERSHFLPWAWSLNGSFSVIATPLACFLTLWGGFKLLLLLAFILYAAALLFFPADAGENRI